MLPDSGELIDDLQVLVDGNLAVVAESIDVSGASTVDQVQYRLGVYFAAEGAPAAVTVMVGDISAGVVTRESLDRASRTAGEPSVTYQMSAGERLQIPGESAQYRLLEFACPRCSKQAFRIYYDERTRPICAAHGQMELQ